MPIGAGAVIGIGASILGGVMGASSAKKAAQAAAREKARLQNKLSNLEKNRQDVVNPYEDFTNLSGMITNPFANLGVATGAAEIKIEEADVSLANTLDTMRATGASAGGATALAQAALQSKKGVAANIEQQEARNEELKARGQQQLDQIKMSEQQRLQNVSISEGQRLQATDAAGKEFMFQQKENRTNADLDRASGQQTQAQQSIADANLAKASAISGGLSSLGSVAGSVISTQG